MYREILKKKEILDMRKPYNAQLRQDLKKAELCDLIFTSLHLDGSAVKKDQVEMILSGEFVTGGTTVNDHMAIHNYVEAVCLMDNLLELHSDLSKKVMEDIHDISTGAEGPIWRKNNVIVYTLDYTPPYKEDVEEKLNAFIKWSYTAGEKMEGNVLLEAAYIHCKLIEIYPFAYNCESTARLLMYYRLKREGFPIFELRVSETEYNSSIIEYLKRGNIGPFYNILERNLFNKLDALMVLTGDGQ